MIIFKQIFIHNMLSSLKLNSTTVLGKDEEKKLTLILNYLIDNPEAAEFLHPVEWESLGLSDYLSVVKHPMHLLKVQEKLKNREYKLVEEVLDHIELIWDNCKEYNPSGVMIIAIAAVLQPGRQDGKVLQEND